MTRTKVGVRRLGVLLLVACTALSMTLMGQGPVAEADESKKPNFLIIWGDDIGWMNPSMYHRGMMGYQTPNIDRIGKEGAMFTD